MKNDSVFLRNKFSNIFLTIKEMEYQAQIQRIYYVLELIDKGRACTPETIASRINVSDRTARRVVRKLKDKGHEIDFCRLQKRYILKK